MKKADSHIEIMNKIERKGEEVSENKESGIDPKDTHTAESDFDGKMIMLKT